MHTQAHTRTHAHTHPQGSHFHQLPAARWPQAGALSSVQQHSPTGHRAPPPPTILGPEPREGAHTSCVGEGPAHLRGTQPTPQRVGEEPQVSICLCGPLDPGPPTPTPPQAPQAYDYRAEVQKLVPQLQVLDDVPTSCTHPPAAGKLTQDGLLVTRAIRDSSALGGLVAGPAGCPHGAPQRQHHVVLSPPEAQPLSPGGLLPKDWAPKDDGSSLTHGVGRVLCGNPTRGLRERRDPGQALEPPRPLPLHGPEDCAARAPRPGPDPADNCSLRVLSEPWAWRDLRLQPLVSWPAGAAALQSPQRGPGNPEGKSEPETRLLRLAPAPAGGSGSTLVPSPPRGPMPPAARTSSWGPANLPLGGRRLRALRGLGPGSPGASWAQGPAPPLRTLAVAAGPSPHTQGYTAPNSTPEPPAGPLRGAQHLNPITAAHSHP
ncbi:leucine-rich repeat-containing protein 56 isoform X7 [Tamandua tetradactyla]|uniref:leucine-rich repeat-containing protein 56 isoform X7 n=1 Tax=Tamandua tetradactyla TaxID=48850 RepID=UPI004053C47B